MGNSIHLSPGSFSNEEYEDWYGHILDGATRLLWISLPSHLLHCNREEIVFEVVSLLLELLTVSGGEVTKPNKNNLRHWTS